YLIHPLSVAEMVADMKLDLTTVIAGLLHDIVEDQLVALADIRIRFGDDVVYLLNGVIKINNLVKDASKEGQTKDLFRIIFATVDDIRVVFFVVMDRLHHMRILEYREPEKRFSFAKETLEIYVPIANRLGMGKTQSELEDLAFRYL